MINSIFTGIIIVWQRQKTMMAVWYFQLPFPLRRIIFFKEFHITVGKLQVPTYVYVTQLFTILNSKSREVWKRFALCYALCGLVLVPWWRHQMETFSALLAIRAGNSPVPGEFPAQRPVTRSFDVFFDLRLNLRLVIWDATAPIMTSQ